LTVSELFFFQRARELFHYREAIRQMVARDLKVRYSHSVLGIVWGLFSPLLMTLVYSLVFTLFVPSGIAKFPVFILAGLLPWNYFSSAVISTTGAITTNGHLINRVFFPREILPVVNVLSNGVNFVLALVMLFAFILFFRVPVGLSLVWLPILITIQLALILGLGLFLAAVNVFFRDTQQIVDILMLAWFFVTPIIYPIDVIHDPALQLAVQALNPMAGLVVAYRQILYAGAFPNPLLVTLTALEALIALAIGVSVFRRLSPTFAEET
jgi:ABC-type polysaccharide/polyol phosphate export permease